LPVELRAVKEKDMSRGWSLSVILAMTMPSPATAQETAARFHWKLGQQLTYKIEQNTSVAELVEGKKTETTSKLNSVKRWQVLGVDEAGTATLQFSLIKLRVETTTPAGETLLFDSADPAKSTPQMRDQMEKYVHQPLGTLRVSALGKVVEVKECKFGPASRFESEPPFVLILADQGLPRQWERNYEITLDPPHGRGEKFAARQQFVIQSINEKMAKVALTTALKNPPQPADEAPLLQALPEGEVVFDVEAGLLQTARLKIDKELQGHQGPGSSYHFQSAYAEEYVADR
jgi:hypothetical protein